MRYVMFMIPAVYADPDAEPMPTAEQVEQMMAFNAELAEAGVLEDLNGLHPPGVGVRVRFTGDSAQVEGVPGQGAVGGYWIISPETHEAAVEWARRCPAQPGDVIELRRIQEAEEFPDDVQDVLTKYDL